MPEDPSKIEEEIAKQREILQGHVEELEAKFQEATEWRTYVRQRPLTMLAGAFSVGLMLAFMFVRSR